MHCDHCDCGITFKCLTIHYNTNCLGQQLTNGGGYFNKVVTCTAVCGM